MQKSKPATEHVPLEDRVDLFGPVPEVGATPIPGKKPTGRGARAYPAPPGTGPEGKRCRDCAYYCRTSSTGNPNNLFSKCLKNRARWTAGPGTDINSRMDACRLFEPADDPEADAKAEALLRAPKRSITGDGRIRP